MSDEETKAVMKEAIKEWLNEKVAEFGWFTLKTMGALVVGALAYFVLTQNGWHK